jgi:type IV fimbrial biogenesis protein FimT
MEVEPAYTRRARGITLVELMTTLAVAGISIAVAVPSWHGLSARSLTTTVANSLLTDLRYARSTAVTRNRYVGLCPSRDGASCSGEPDRWHEGYLLFIDQDRNRERDPGEPLLRQRLPAQPGLRMQTTVGRPMIQFRPDGTAWSTNATFSICVGEESHNRRAVVLYGSGRARVDREGPEGRDIRCV